MSSPLLPRIVLGILLTTGIVFSDLYQPCLTWLYDQLYNSALYNLSTFETILTVTTYIVLEPLYTYKFGHNPLLRIDLRSNTGVPPKGLKKGSKPKLPKMQRPSKRLGELIIYATPLLLLDFTMIKKFAGVPINDIRISGGFEAIPTDGKLSSPMFAILHSTMNFTSDTGSEKPISSSFLLPTLHNFTTTSPLQLRRALPPSPPTTRRIILELATSLVIYDFLFFTFHLFLHRIRLLSRIHLAHHTHAEMHPQITNRLSVSERLGLVLLANFSLNIIGSHVLTRTLFVPLFVYLLIEVHCGMDLPWGYHRILPWGWASGPVEHARHHRTGEGNYAPFFNWCDQLLHLIGC